MNKNSGGHRYGSNQFIADFYTPEAYNGGLLDEVGNKLKKPPIDAALSETPLKDALITGLLSKDNGGSYGGGNYDFGGRLGDTEDKGTTSPAGSASSTFGGGGLLNGSSLSMAQQAALGGAAQQGAIGFATGGLLGGMVGAAKGGTSAYNSQMSREAAATEARQMATMNAYAQAQREADAIAAQQALAAAQAAASRSGGSGGSFGSSSYGGNDAHNGDSSHGSRGW